MNFASRTFWRLGFNVLNILKQENASMLLHTAAVKMFSRLRI